MTYQVLREIRVKTGQGEAILSPGQMIRLDPAKAGPLIELGKLVPIPKNAPEIFSLNQCPIKWKNPHPLVSLEARQQSLQEVMDAIILTARGRIIEAHQGRQYKATDELQKAEHEVERLQHDVMNGQASISDYRAACEKWVSLAIKNLQE